MADAIQEREQRLIRSERLATVGRMAAQITHEVRNPLASIGLNAELLGDEIADRGEEARRLVDVDHQRGRSPDRDHRDLPALRAPAAAQAGSRGPRRDRRVGGSSSRAPSWRRRGIALQRRHRARAARDRRRRGAAAAGAAQPGAQRARGDGEGGGLRRLAVAGGAWRARRSRASPSPTRGRASRAENLGKIFDPFFSTKERGTGPGAGAGAADRRRARRPIEVDEPAGRGTTLHADAARCARRPRRRAIRGGRGRRRRGGRRRGCRVARACRRGGERPGAAGQGIGGCRRRSARSKAAAAGGGLARGG